MTVIPLPIRRSAEFADPIEAYERLEFLAPEVSHHEAEPIYHAEGFAHVSDSLAPAHWTLSLPATADRRRLAIITGGYFGVEAAHDDLRDAMTSENDSAVVTHSLLRGNLSNVRDPHGLRTDTIAAVIDDVLRSPAVADLPGGNLLDTKSADLIEHSMSGKAGLDYALRQPSDVHSLTLFQAVGAEKHVGVLGFARRLPRTFSFEIVPALIKSDLRRYATTKKLGEEILHYTFANVPMTVAEAFCCPKTDITPEDMERLHASGVLTALLYGSRDSLVPAKPAINRLSKFVNYAEVNDFNHFSAHEHGAIVARRLAAILQYLASPLPEQRHLSVVPND